MIRIARFAARIRALTGWRRMAAAWLAGALAALALPPIGAWPLLFIAFPALVWMIDGAAPRARSGFAAGWAFGFGYFAVALHWIGFAFLVEADTYLWMMPFAVGGLAAVLAVYWGIAAGIAARFWPPGLARVFFFASLLALAEIARGHLLTGFPWAAPGLIAMADLGFAQAASVIGMTGLTLAIVLIGAMPALLAEPSWRNGLAVGAAVAGVLLASAVGDFRLSAGSADVEGVRLRIVQPNISQDMKWRAENARNVFESLMALSFEGGAPATHVIWPESAVPFLIEKSEEAQARIAAALPEGASLFLGAIREDGQGRTYNSILGYDSDANLIARYDKWRLVPGGEFLPFASILEPLGIQKMVETPGSFEPGAGPATLPIPGAPPAGFLVCYEAIFPDRLVDPESRPQWLINVTNDGWFGNSTGPYQHLAQLRMRAIEQGLPAARAANTGISAIVDSFGRVESQLPIGSAGYLDDALPAAIPMTAYARFGDCFAVAAILLVLLARLIVVLRQKAAS
jgi:apolipoprotein N-acyltransferase